MVLRIPISLHAEARLKAKAAAAGVDVETYAAGQLERFSETTRPLAELSGSIAEAVAASGMSEDDFADLLEVEKHAMRSERRARKAE